jgi:hypothetical protein
MHVILLFLGLYISSVIVTVSLILVSTKRNRLPMFAIVILLPIMLLISVVSTIADIFTGKIKQRVNQANSELFNIEWKSAVNAVEAKRVQMFGGSFRETKFANALRERYCIHLTKSADWITNRFYHHRMAA